MDAKTFRTFKSLTERAEKKLAKGDILNTMGVYTYIWAIDNIKKHHEGEIVECGLWEGYCDGENAEMWQTGKQAIVSCYKAGYGCRWEINVYKHNWK